MGKTAKEFTLTKPNSPASKGRTYAIYCAVGVDVRDVEGLTNKQAHKMLDDANNGLAYHVRDGLIRMGGRTAKKDVAKKLRSDPKPTNGKSKAKAEPDDELATLIKMLRKRPELLTSLLAGDGEAEEDEPEPKPKPKAKTGNGTTKAQKRTAAATGTKVRTKSGNQVTINKDDTISDADLLSMLSGAVKQAV